MYTTALIALPMLFSSLLTSGQSDRLIQWHFTATHITPYDVVLTMTADVGQDWYIYSQYMEGSGPAATQFRFEPQTELVFIGKVKEKGNPITYYDDIYEMNITKYAGRVSFEQQVKLSNPVTTITATVEYMVCSDHMCVPAVKQFTFKISPN